MKRKYKIPLICTIELINEPNSLSARLVYFLSRFLLTKAPIDQFILWSDYYWENHLKEWGINQRKVTVIPAGIDIKVYHPQINGSKIKKKYSSRAPLIVFAKPLHFQNTQAVKLLVRTIAFLKPKVKVKLLLGSGDGKEEIQTLARKLEVIDQIAFMPSVSFPQIPAYLSAADLIVLPFTYPPTTACSLLEAMAMGKPIITTPRGEIKRMLRHEVQALLVENHPKKLGKAVETLIENKTLAKKLGQNARQLAVRQYSLDKVVRQTVDGFIKVVN